MSVRTRAAKKSTRKKHQSGLLGCLVVPVVGIRYPRLTTVQVLDLERVLRVKLGEFGLEVLLDERLDVLRSLRGDETVVSRE